MASPIYEEDLTDIDLAEDKSTWVALGGGAAGLVDEGDFLIQGAQSISKQINNATKGQVYNNSTTIDVTGSDGAKHVYTWIYVSTPSVLDTEINGGIRVTIGDTTTDRKEWYVRGADTYALGGWICHPVYYDHTASNTIGSPAGDPQYFGSVAATTGTVKTANLAVDAMRYGIGGFMYSGELISAGDVSDDPATFSGFAAENDTNANRWGILQESPGGYSLQGGFHIGQTSAGTNTQCRFKDQNQLIVFPDTPYTNSGFTYISIHEQTTWVELDNITFLALGTNNPGIFSVKPTGATVLLESCTFTDIGTTLLKATTTATDCTWRGCDLITSQGATTDNCLFDSSNSTTAALVTKLDDVASSTFISAGSGHALEIRDITVTPQVWNSIAEGYATGDGSTGTEILYINKATGSITINVPAGSTPPSVRTAGATVTVVLAAVTTEVHVINPDGNDLENARVYVTAAAGGPLSEGTIIINDLTDSGGLVSDTRELSADQPVEGWVRLSTTSPYYRQGNVSSTIDNVNGVNITVQLILDE